MSSLRHVRTRCAIYDIPDTAFVTSSRCSATGDRHSSAPHTTATAAVNTAYSAQTVRLSEKDFPATVRMGAAANGRAMARSILLREACSRGRYRRRKRLRLHPVNSK